jgi:hypothetical protein
MSHRRKHRIKLKSLYVWHRYVGLTAALFVILLASSGIALNHTEDLALDHRHVQSRWLLDWYGIQAPDSALSATTTHGSLTLLGTKLYFNAQPLDGEFRTFYSVVAKDGLLVAAVDHDLLLLTAQGEYVERLSKDDGAPGEIENLGLDTQGQLIAATETGLYRADAQLLDWQPWMGMPESIAWNTPQPLTGTALARLQVDFLGRILPWERVLLDLHSGRLFGTPGPWLMDAAAMLMLFLAGSGVAIWSKRKR